MANDGTMSRDDSNQSAWTPYSYAKVFSQMVSISQRCTCVKKKLNGVIETTESLLSGVIVSQNCCHCFFMILTQ